MTNAEINPLKEFLKPTKWKITFFVLFMTISYISVCFVEFPGGCTSAQIMGGSVLPCPLYSSYLSCDKEAASHFLPYFIIPNYFLACLTVLVIKNLRKPKID